MLFINPYWKDDCSGTGKTGGFCKYKSSSLYNQAVEVIFQEEAVMLTLALTIQIAQASEKASIRKYLQKVAQTVQYLARPR